MIPARWGSTRFPGKPLAEIKGIPMINRVASNAVEAVGIENVVVVTDDDRIESSVGNLGVEVVRVDQDCPSGTDRIAIATTKYPDLDYVFNLQGDEPLISAGDIAYFVDETLGSSGSITNGYFRTEAEDVFLSQNRIKMMVSHTGRVVGASRLPVPSLSKEKHIQACIYGMPIKSMNWFQSTDKLDLSIEAKENIEILRFIEHGYEVRGIELSRSNPVDTAEDINIVESMLSQGF